MTIELKASSTLRFKRLEISLTLYSGILPGAGEGVFVGLVLSSLMSR